MLLVTYQPQHNWPGPRIFNNSGDNNNLLGSYTEERKSKYSLIYKFFSTLVIIHNNEMSLWPVSHRGHNTRFDYWETECI